MTLCMACHIVYSAPWAAWAAAVATASAVAELAGPWMVAGCVLPVQLHSVIRVSVSMHSTYHLLAAHGLQQHWLHALVYTQVNQGSDRTC